MRDVCARGWLVAAAFAVPPAFATDPPGPAFDCTAKLTSSVEQRICKDPQLAALDRTMADAFSAALAKAPALDAQAMSAGQRAWLKTRNDCWKVAEVVACVEDAYRDRLSELQARYRLLEPAGGGRYVCPGPPPQVAVADFFNTDPPTAMVQFGGATQFMRVAGSGSGVRYKGGNRQLYELPTGVALITWGASTIEMQCPKQ